MKKIVFIGKFFPEVSYEALLNYLILKELKESGNYVILISDSWNHCSYNNYISNEEGVTNIIDEYYYLDPVQLNYSDYNINVGLIALFKKVLKYQKVDMVVTSNIIDYGLVMEYIKEKFFMVNSLVVNDRSIFRFISDDYTGEIAFEVINSFDKIIISERFAEYLKMCTAVDKNKVFKKDIHNYISNNRKSDYILIFGVVDNLYFVNSLNEYIRCLKQNILIVIYGIGFDECKLRILKMDNICMIRPSSISELLVYFLNAKQIIDCHYFINRLILEDYNGVLRKYNCSVLGINENDRFVYSKENIGEVDIIK